MDRCRVGSFSDVPSRPTIYARDDRAVTRPPVLTQSGYGRVADNPGVNREERFPFPSAARLNFLTLHLHVIAA